MALGVGHDGAVDETKADVGVATVERHCAFEQAGRQVRDGVLLTRQRSQESVPGSIAVASAQQYVRLGGDRVEHHQVTPECTHQLGRELVVSVAPVGGGDQRAGVADDLQLRRFRSARSARSRIAPTSSSTLRESSLAPPSAIPT